MGHSPPRPHGDLSMTTSEDNGVSKGEASVSLVDGDLKDWPELESTAEAMIPLIGTLYRERAIVTSVFGRPIINRSPISILKAHKVAREIGHKISVLDTYPILLLMSKMGLGSARIDIGKFAAMYAALTQEEKDSIGGLQGFLDQQLFCEKGTPGELLEPRDVVLYGFGRIGRLLARIMIEKAGNRSLRLKAIVVRDGKAADDLGKRASLLRRDSIHGSFHGTVEVDRERSWLIANGNAIQVIYANNPTEVDYTKYGINNALLIDNTGVWRDEEGLSQHLNCPGVNQVLLTAPGKGDLPNVVMGVNHRDAQDHKIISAASCTTNAIVPVLKVLHDELGIKHGHVETVHSYTNDQNLIDNYHKGSRRGRSAALNMVVTETGAAKAVSKALPELEGKLSGNAIRVPTPDVSLAILNLGFEKQVTKEGLNKLLKDASVYSEYYKQIDFVESDEAVSTDFVGSRHASIVDGLSTICDEDRAVLYVWYDNEFGYSCQVIRLAQYLSGMTTKVFPTKEAWHL